MRRCSRPNRFCFTYMGDSDEERDVMAVVDRIDLDGPAQRLVSPERIF